jgi:hypothetical protein
VVVGGDAPAPVLAMDGSEAGDSKTLLAGIDVMSQNACGAMAVQFASREYLNATAKTLIERLIQA